MVSWIANLISFLSTQNFTRLFSTLSRNSLSNLEFSISIIEGPCSLIFFSSASCAITTAKRGFFFSTAYSYFNCVKLLPLLWSILPYLPPKTIDIRPTRQSTYLLLSFGIHLLQKIVPFLPVCGPLIKLLPLQPAVLQSGRYKWIKQKFVVFSPSRLFLTAVKFRLGIF